MEGHRTIVRYLDSHAARSSNGVGYEVFVLMEYCSGHGLIDFMNTRLRDMLSEPEILQIACDIGLGIANMHYLSPPLIHRDLKIENVLISGDGVYKLCDFGSVSAILRPPRNPAELQILDNDIQSHTTAQYRSPEMIDIARGFPIDEKSDIWAFGVFIYKLCYYTTPFEREGNLAILNASFTFPPKPVFSDRLKRVINVTLSEDPRLRPNIFQCLKELYSMRGMDVPIKDIYTAPTSTVWVNASTPHDKLSPSLPINDTTTDSSAGETPPQLPKRGIVHVAPTVNKQAKPIPKVKPMFRGRPQTQNKDAPPVASPRQFNTEGDPFTVTDGSGSVDATEDVESKYPTIEALTQSLEKQSFNFSTPQSKPPPTTSLSSGALSSSSQPPVTSASQSMPGSISQTPVPVDMDYNIRTSALSGVSWDPNGYNPQLPLQPSNDPWTPAPRPIMVNHSTMTSPVQSRSTTPATRKGPIMTYDLSSSDDEAESVPPAKTLPPPVPATRGRKSEDSLRVPEIQVQLSGKEGLGEIPRPNSTIQVESYGEIPPPPPKRRSAHESIDSTLIEPMSVDDKDHLKAMLTGLSEKSTTVILDDDENTADKNYLDPLAQEGTGRQWRTHHTRKHSGHLAVNDQEEGRNKSRSRSRSRHKKSSSMSLKNITSSAFKMFEMPRPVGSTQKRTSNEYGRSIPGSVDNAGGEIDEPEYRDPETILRSYSFMESEDPSLYERPKTATQTNQPLGRAPSVLVQNRIQAFINRNPSPPPPRVATGYGHFIDGIEPPAEPEKPKRMAPKLPTKPKHLQSPRRTGD